MTLRPLVLLIPLALAACSGTESGVELNVEPTETAEAVEVLNQYCPTCAFDENGVGMDVVADVHTEYEGQTVHFCCAGCIQTFEENPEAYLAHLPQFQGESAPETEADPTTAPEEAPAT